ncbi:hypothetical protein GCM10010231_65800 [Streptomyces sindenensis]|nr:hypothetical protein GCM10010231_65800 [Streptomyces sindenensis]
MQALDSAQRQGLTAAPAGYGYRAVPPRQVPYLRLHHEGVFLAVPRTGDQLAARFEQVSRLGGMRPGGGNVVHGQAQNPAFVPGGEKVAEQHRQFLE